MKTPAKTPAKARPARRSSRRTGVLQRYRFRTIETFEEIVRAHQMISELIFVGGLDDFGPAAEIIPTEFEIDARGETSAVLFIVRAPRDYVDRIPEGVSLHDGIRLELTKPGSNVAILRPRESPVFTEQYVDTKFAISV